MMAGRKSKAVTDSNPLEPALESDERKAERFLASIRELDGESAQRLLEECPAIVRTSIHAAAAAGAADVVAEFIRHDPSGLERTHGVQEWPPLAYACASPLHALDGSRASALLDTATRLVDAGASANSASAYVEDNGTKAPISVLYHAIMSNHVAVARLLLERGARTQDGESIYHAAQYNRRECLDLLRRHGADFSSRQSPYGNTPLFFLAGHHNDDGGQAAWAQGFLWLLEHGADPDVSSDRHESRPLHVLASGGRHHVLQWTVAFGADVNAARLDGRTPYVQALRSGNAEGAAFLIAHGASTDTVTPTDELLAACLAADDVAARAVLAREPGLMATLTEEDRAAVNTAAHLGRLDAVRLMVALGFPIDVEHEGASPLHWAAWFGRLEMVRLLLDLGAPVNIRDRRFGSSPVGWAAHGSRFNERPGSDERFCAIVDLLLDAGGDRAASFNRWGDPPEKLANAAVRKRLLERHVASPSSTP
jgi:ankyrin repeat protein